MAIKTKKITDLGQIEVENIDILKKNDFYFLGCMGGVTGKVSTSDVVNAIRANVEDFVYPHQNTQIAEVKNQVKLLSDKLETSFGHLDKVDNVEKTLNVLSGDVDYVKTKITEQDTFNSELNTFRTSTDDKINNLVYNDSTNTGKIRELEIKIAELESKVSAFETFVQALQADGYLTLANIKKAAADACPVEVSAE